MEGSEERIELDAGPARELTQVNAEEAAIKDKKAYYELLVRAGWFLPKLSSKFIN